MKNSYYRAHIDITGRCNLRCIHCYASSRYGDELDIETLSRILKKLKSLGVKRIAISGGEPLLHPDLYEILTFSPDDISILTNAHLISEEFIEKLENLEKKGKIFTLRISLDGLDSYKRVRNITYDRVIDNIKKLLERELIVVVNTTIMPFHTKEELIKLYNLVLKLRVDQWNVDIPFHEGSAKRNDIVTEGKKYADIIVEIAKLYIKNKPEMIFDSVGLFTSSQLDPSYEPHLFQPDENPCSYQLSTITIDAKGRIKICPSMLLSVGTIFDFKNLEDFRKSTKWRNYESMKVSDFEECPTCKYREICGGGCRANVINKGLMTTDKLSCYLMERFEEDIIPLLPSNVGKIYRKSINRCLKSSQDS